MPDSTLLREVRARLQGYLLGAESLSEFHNWFVITASALRSSGGADATVKTIELRLAEYKRGDWSEPRLRARLLEDLPLKTFGASTGESEPWMRQNRAPGDWQTDKAGNIR